MVSDTIYVLDREWFLFIKGFFNKWILNIEDGSYKKKVFRFISMISISSALQTRDTERTCPLMFRIVPSRLMLEVLQANAITTTSKGMVSSRIVYADVYIRHMKDRNNQGMRSDPAPRGSGNVPLLVCHLSSHVM